MNQVPHIIEGLNNSQSEAATTTKGPVLVIAGAGSGKTRALTHRIAYLIRECGVRPSNILAVTFTNKAAGEMRDRIIRLLGKTPPEGKTGAVFNDPDLPTIGTFHSVCVRILRKHINLLGYSNQFVIYDTSDQLILMKHIAADMQIGDKEINLRSVLGQVSNAKSKMVEPAEYEKMASSYFEERVARMYHEYQDRLKKNDALDFDDILTKTVELFQNNPTVLDYYQEKFQYIHVDEYQDTNHTQYLLTNMLAAKYRNICVIGDHDQSIYSWRGATIQNILDFEKDYKEVVSIKMEQNYRSTQIILDAAQAIIEKNKKRKAKKLWTERDGGDLVKLWVAENERHEGELIASAVRDCVRSHETPDYKDFVVLYRTNAQSRVLEEVFMRYGIPYKIIGGIRFYERKEIKDLISYLKVVANNNDSVSLSRIINTPPRQIGPKTLEYIQTFAHAKDCGFFEAMTRVREVEGLPDAKYEKVENFVKMIRGLQQKSKEMGASALVKFVLDETGYKKFLDDNTIEGEARLENVSELASVATKYDKLEPGISLNVFLEEVALISDLDSMDEKDNAVTFMTLHAAKGLEFPWVFIAGLEEGLLPHTQSMLAPEELEEERRLLYVGCTRAMDRLHLLYAKNRMLYGESKYVIPSQFIADIPEELLEKNTVNYNRQARSISTANIGNTPVPLEKPLQEFSDGDRVNHSTFGEGMVISVTGGVVTVAFSNPKYGIKKLAIAIAPLEKI